MEYQRPSVPSLPVRLLPRPVSLVGREELMADIHARLSADDRTGPRIVALYGLAGAGKTSVAVEYAHRHLDELAVTWQFLAEEPTALAAAFGELAAQLGVRDLLDARDPVAQVHAVLATRPADWLLIFDNPSSLATIQRFLPPAGQGRVLITSQNPHWPGSQALEMPMLDQDEATDFLLTRTHSADIDTARYLAGELGGLPLALEQAAAYMLATGRSMAEYLVVFHDQRSQLLSRGEPAGYDKTVASTWALAFEQLQQSAPLAVALLRLLACCAPEQIPLRLLLRPRPKLIDAVPAELLFLPWPSLLLTILRTGLAALLRPRRLLRLLRAGVAPFSWPRRLPRALRAEVTPLLNDQLAAADALASLRNFSLISAPQDGLVSVHQLVQAVTLDQLPSSLERKWRQAAQSVIEAALLSDPAQPETWADYAALLPHAELALPAENGGMLRIASFLGNSGNYAASRALLQRVVVARERMLGAKHPITLAERGSLARWTGEAGDPAAARAQYALLLPLIERVLGAEHPSTLAERAGLARWTAEAGDPVGACEQFAALVPVAERVFGAEHPSSLTVRTDLATWTGPAGDPDGARDQLAALLPVSERVLGAKHPGTLTIRGNLATWTGECGDPDGARDQLAALLPVCERVFGAEHPDTLITRGNLATWTGECGDPDGARDQFTALLPVCERVFGAEHPDTLITRTNLATWTGKAGDPVAARQQFAALLPLRERVSGRQHPRTATDRANLASWTRRANE